MLKRGIAASLLSLASVAGAFDVTDDPSVAARPPNPHAAYIVGDPSFGFEPHDLPIPLREGRYEKVGFGFEIDEQGRIQNCAVTKSSGNSEVDALTCRLASERAHYNPATDAKGHPIRSRGSRTISWSAFVYGQDMATCAVAAASDRDQIAIMRWLYSAITTTPQLEDLVSVLPAKLEALRKEATAVFQRVIFEDCRPQAVAALKYGDMSTLMEGFQAMGMAAGRKMMLNPQAMVTLQAKESLFDPVKLGALAKDAGVSFSDVSAFPSTARGR